MQDEYEEYLKNNVKDLRNYLESAFYLAQKMQIDIKEKEGDSDLFRKFAFYLTPNLNHWINGLQAGNIKDLEITILQKYALTKKKI